MTYGALITVYNDENFISRCIEALLSQSIKAENIIVVDDNSTDNTGIIIDKYPVKKIFSSEPKYEERWLNRVRAFKLGLNSIEKQYDLILKVDSDIIIPENYVETLITHFKNDEKLAACSGVQNPNMFQSLPRNGAIIYRHDLISNAEKINEVYAWDRWLLLWLIENGYNTFVDNTVKYYELRDSKLTNKEAKLSGVVRRRENYPLKAALLQAILQGGLKSLYFIYGYITGKGPERHSKEFIKEYSKKEEMERMKYICKNWGSKKRR